MAKGIVSNVSRNPIELPDGSMLAAGETRSDFDESSLKSDNIFIKGGMLVVGKDAKALQSQLDDSGVEVADLQAKVEELQAAVLDLTGRAEKAEAENASLKAAAKK